MKVITGIQPSGQLHIGNYFGSMKKMIELQDSTELFTFIADYHSLTSSKDPNMVKRLTVESAIDYLALGLNPQKATFWVQSDVKEVLELYWILSKYTPMGLLERGHSYKDKTSKGISANHALFSYPVLMAADILLYNIEKVPVGKDQIQHIEMTRDIARSFNNNHGNIFTIPEYIVDVEVAVVPGINGDKMSKSYENTIDLFMNEKDLTNQCKKIITDSKSLTESKDWKTCNVYALAKLFLNNEQQLSLQERYLSGKEGYGHFKLYLKELIWEYFSEARERKAYYHNNLDEVFDILSDGSKKASIVAKEKMQEVREVIGLYK